MLVPVRDHKTGPFGIAIHEYADVGIPTFPLGGDDGKLPLVKNANRFSVKASLTLANRHRGANIGFWCGRPGPVDHWRKPRLAMYRTVGGGPTFIRYGRLILYKPSALADWIASRTRELRNTSEAA